MATEKQVSVLLSLILPHSFDTSQWPVHMIIKDGTVGAGMWGGLDVVIRMGLMDPGEASHLVALTFDDQDYPDWLPKTTLAGPWCARVIMPILEHSLKGDMPESEGVQLWPLGTEPPKPNLKRDSIHVSLRGEPMGEPAVRHCWLESGEPVFQAALSIKARHMVFRAARIHPDREKLQEEIDAIYTAGDVQVVGTMENRGAGDELLLDVSVEHWAPVEEEPC